MMLTLTPVERLFRIIYLPTTIILYQGEASFMVSFQRTSKKNTFHSRPSLPSPTSQADTFAISGHNGQFPCKYFASRFHARYSIIPIVLFFHLFSSIVFNVRMIERVKDFDIECPTSNQTGSGRQENGCRTCVHYRRKARLPNVTSSSDKLFT